MKITVKQLKQLIKEQVADYASKAQSLDEVKWEDTVPRQFSKKKMKARKEMIRARGAETLNADSTICPHCGMEDIFDNTNSQKCNGCGVPLRAKDTLEEQNEPYSTPGRVDKNELFDMIHDYGVAQRDGTSTAAERQWNLIIPAIDALYAALEEAERHEAYY